MTKPQMWDRHAILAQLRRQGITLVGIAKQYGLSASSVKNIWSRPNEKAEQAIADFLKQPVEQVFGDRYPKTGNRILKRPNVSRSKHTTVNRKAA